MKDLDETGSNVDTLYERMLIFLEDKEFDRADEYAERILDISPKFAPAYIGKVCAKLQVTHPEDLPSQKVALNDIKEFQKALRFATADQLETYQEYAELNEGMMLHQDKSATYEQAVGLIDEERYVKALDLLKPIIGFRDVDAKMETVERTLNKKYHDAQEMEHEGDYFKAWIAFLDINGYQDADAQAQKILEQHSVSASMPLGNGEHWSIITTRGTKALLLRDEVLRYYGRYFRYSSRNPANWEDSSIASWENSSIRKDLVETWFSKELISKRIQKCIVPVKIESETINKIDGVSTKYITTDKIFLLSQSEAEEYLPKASQQIAKFTDFDIAIDGGWYLRSPVHINAEITINSRAENTVPVMVSKGDTFRIIDKDGSEYYIGGDQYNGNYTSRRLIGAVGLRPAMWIDNIIKLRLIIESESISNLLSDHNRSIKTSLESVASLEKEIRSLKHTNWEVNKVISDYKERLDELGILKIGEKKRLQTEISLYQTAHDDRVMEIKHLQRIISEQKDKIEEKKQKQEEAQKQADERLPAINAELGALDG